MAKIDKSKYRIRKRSKAGCCRIMENDKGCNRPIHQRGLCTRHCSYFRLHLCFEEFALPVINRKKTTFEVKKKISTKVCRIVDGGVPCMNDSMGRGLCAAHHRYFTQRDLLEKYGEFDKKFILHRDLSFTSRVELKLCGLIIDGKRCPRSIEGLGLCKRHYISLRYNEMLEGLSTPKQFPRVHSIAAKKKIVKGKCCMIINNKPCVNLINSRGVCKKCYSILGRRGCIDEYALPPLIVQKAKYTVNKKPRSGICRIKVNGNFCKDKTYSRGLCRNHYSNFWARGTLRKLGKSTWEDKSYGG